MGQRLLKKLYTRDANMLAAADHFSASLKASEQFKTRSLFCYVILGVVSFYIHLPSASIGYFL